MSFETGDKKIEILDKNIFEKINKRDSLLDVINSGKVTINNIHNLQNEEIKNLKLLFNEKLSFIYIANLNPTLGSEQAGMRPVVIISGNSFNKNKNLVMACPTTSKIKNYYGDIILVPDATNGLTHESEVLGFQMRTITTDRLIQKIGTLSQDEIKEIIKGIGELLVL